jgi:arylsulfatase A-like enzyme
MFRILLLGLLFNSSAALLAVPTPQAERPNVVVFLVDDMGWSDLGCFGGEIKTPNLDQLARDGVRFTQFYNTARCCSTRASVLTGLYPHQAGVGHMTNERRDSQGNVHPGYSGRLNNTSVTIAEVLSQAGYFTAMTGKWHVGQNFGVKPEDRGFQRTLTAAAGGFYFQEGRGARLFYNGRDIGNGNEEPTVPKNWYSSDLWVDFGLKFIDEALAQKKPFFLYNAFNAPHFPLQAPAEDIARWRGRFKAEGWDKLREARYQRQLAAGLIDPAWKLSPRPQEVPAWDSLGPEDQDHYDHLMAIYAAVVERMDRAVGTLVEGLKKRGQLDNTLILFMSDNGGNAEAGVRGRANGENLGDARSDVFIGQCWATLNNTPFVRYKHHTDEGGISTPLIVHWPNAIAPERRGTLEKQPGHLIDIMATCIDVAHAEYPKEFKGHAITPFEGTSLVPAFHGKSLQRKNPLFWEHEANRAIRDGDLKLVALENQPWRLYDLAADRTEQHDLAAEKPELVQSLASQWDAWAARANVLPLGAWRAPAGAPAKYSKKKRFELKNGDHLDQEHAPNVGQRPFNITAKVDLNPQQDGVIVAQGGLTHGYTLFVKDGQLTFLTRTRDKLTRVSLNPAPSGNQTIIAALGADSTQSLSVGAQTVSIQRDGFIKSTPLDGLDVGEDRGALVGPYQSSSPFQGEIQSVIIELGRN